MKVNEAYRTVEGWWNSFKKIAETKPELTITQEMAKKYNQMVKVAKSHCPDNELIQELELTPEQEPTMKMMEFSMKLNILKEGLSRALSDEIIRKRPPRKGPAY